MLFHSRQQVLGDKHAEKHKYMPAADDNQNCWQQKISSIHSYLVFNLFVFGGGSSKPNVLLKGNVSWICAVQPLSASIKYVVTAGSTKVATQSFASKRAKETRDHGKNATSGDNSLNELQRKTTSIKYNIDVDAYVHDLDDSIRGARRCDGAILYRTMYAAYGVVARAAWAL